MTQSNVRSIKLAKKEALLFKELSQLFMRLSMDEPELHGIHISRVELSRDGGICFILFYTDKGETEFHAKMSLLILYKPSLRKALSKNIASRYTPDLVFKFDEKFEKQARIDALLDKIKSEDHV